MTVTVVDKPGSKVCSTFLLTLTGQNIDISGRKEGWRLPSSLTWEDSYSAAAAKYLQGLLDFDEPGEAFYMAATATDNRILDSATEIVWQSLHM
jgi:hypothetical protein